MALTPIDYSQALPPVRVHTKTIKVQSYHRGGPAGDFLCDPEEKTPFRVVEQSLEETIKAVEPTPIAPIEEEKPDFFDDYYDQEYEFDT